MAKKQTKVKDKEEVAIRFKNFYIICPSGYTASRFMEELERLCNEYAASPDSVFYQYDCEE